MRFTKPSDLLEEVGQPMGSSGWQEITQEQVNAGLNYGPVPVGGRLRGQVTLAAAEERRGGVEAVFGISFELEGAERPACVAEVVVLYL